MVPDGGSGVALPTGKDPGQPFWVNKTVCGEAVRLLSLFPSSQSTHTEQVLQDRAKSTGAVLSRPDGAHGFQEMEMPMEPS